MVNLSVNRRNSYAQFFLSRYALNSGDAPSNIKPYVKTQLILSASTTNPYACILDNMFIQFVSPPPQKKPRYQ